MDDHTPVAADRDQPHALTFTLREADIFWYSASTYDTGQAEPYGERFESLSGHFGGRVSVWSTAVDALADPVFDRGAIVWCASGTDALMFAKIHEAAGHATMVLWDIRAKPGQHGYAVLTSHDVMDRDRLTSSLTAG